MGTEKGIQQLDGRWKMSSKHDGVISASLLSLQLQLKSLLDEAGGDDVLAVLDQLSLLSAGERALALAAFSQAVDRVSKGSTRLHSAEDEALKELEEGLYQDIVSAIEEAERAPVQAALGCRKLAVLDGGKCRPAISENHSSVPTPIDFSRRKSKKFRSRSALN